MTDILNVDDERAAAGEIETEYEDLGDEQGDEEEAEEEPCEDVPEDVPAVSSAPAGDYAVPEQNKEVWQKFGCNTEAGRMLRKLYSGGSQSSASKVAYPRLKTKMSWEAPGPNGLPVGQSKPCPQRAVIRVPRPAYERPDRDDPKNWRRPMPGRKPQSEIQAEMDAMQPERPCLPMGRNQDKAKDHLQDRNQYCGGRMMPPGAAGHVEKSAMPKALVRPSQERRALDENGMNAEQREMFQELTEAIRDKQGRLAALDAEEKADPRPSKKRTDQNKEALQLRNDIDRDLKDVDKFLELIDP